MDMEWVITLATLFVICIVSVNNLPQTIVSLVRCEMVSKRNALFLVGIAGALGYILQGSKVTYTVAYKLFHYDPNVFLAGIIISALFLIFSTVYNISTSIQQLMILSLFGIYYSTAGWVNMKLMGIILLSWFGNMLLTILLVVLLSASLKRLVNSVSIYDRAVVMNAMAIFSSILLAYAMGANTFGTIASVLGANFTTMHSKAAIVISIFYGVLMFNIFGELKKSKLLESFDVYYITCAQLGCGISVILFSIMGIPVSIIHALVSSLMAIALIKKMSIVEKKVEHVMFRNLILVPLISFFVGFIAGFLFF